MSRLKAKKLSTSSIISQRQIREIQWKPHPGPQEIFLNLFHSGVYEVLFGGTKGPGKTEMLLKEATRQVMNPNYRGIIFRRTFPRIGEIIDRSAKYYKNTGIGGGAKFSSRDNLLQLPAWTWPSGAKVAFCHMQNEQDKYNIQGKEFHFEGWDQLEEFTESQYLFGIAQNRTSDKSIKCYIRATANPGGIGHSWVKSRFIDRLKSGEIRYFKREDDEDIECQPDDAKSISRSFVFSNVYDNPSIIENDPDYIKRLEQMGEKDKQALLYGNWDVFSGQFFDMWRKNIHVVHKDINKDSIKFISLDYGYGAQSCAIWWQVDYDGNLNAYRELYREGLTYESLAKTIMLMTEDSERISYIVADPAIWGDRTHHKDNIQGESGAETMQRMLGQFSSLIKADNNRLTGWGRMRIMLTPKDGIPSMTFSPVCVNCIRTIPALIHDENKIEDVNTEGEDHAGDSCRYGAMSRPFMPVRTVKDTLPRYCYERIEREIEREKEKSQDSLWT